MMKKLLLFAVLFAGLASCANNPEETALAPDPAHAAVCQTPDEAELAAYTPDFTKKIVIGDQTVYNGTPLFIPNGTYDLTYYTQYQGKWVTPTTRNFTTTGDISVSGYQTNQISIYGSGTLTVVGLPESLFGSATIYINPDPMEDKVRFSIDGREVFSGETVMLRRGNYEVTPAYYTNGKWTNFNATASTTDGNVRMDGTTLKVAGNGTLVMSQPGTDVMGMIYITVPDESVQFLIDDNTTIYGNETIALSQGTHKVYMLYQGRSLHVAVYKTTGAINMSSPNAPYFTVSGDGSLTISELGTDATGTLYIRAKS